MPWSYACVCAFLVLYNSNKIANRYASACVSFDYMLLSFGSFCCCYYHETFSFSLSLSLSLNTARSNGVVLSHALYKRRREILKNPFFSYRLFFFFFFFFFLSLSVFPPLRASHRLVFGHHQQNKQRKRKKSAEKKKKERNDNEDDEIKKKKNQTFEILQTKQSKN